MKSYSAARPLSSERHDVVSYVVPGASMAANLTSSRPSADNFEQIRKGRRQGTSDQR